MADRTRIRSGGTIRARFERHADAWHDETDGMSAGSRITSSAHYLAIIALGKPAIPLILRDLESRGGFWYPALQALSGEWPVDESDNGKPRRMKEAWIAWGRQHGYLEGASATPASA